MVAFLDPLDHAAERLLGAAPLVQEGRQLVGEFLAKALAERAASRHDRLRRREGPGRTHGGEVEGLAGGVAERESILS